MGSDNSKNGDEREAKRNQTNREVGQRLYTEDEIVRVLVNQKRMFEAEQAMMPARQRLYTEDEIRRALVHQKKKFKAKQSKMLASITQSAPEEELVFSASNTTASRQTYQQDITARLPTPLPSVTRSASKEEVVFPPNNSKASGQTYQQNSSDRPPTPYPSITRSAPKVEVVFPRSNRTALGQTYQQNSSDRPPTPYPSITRSAPKEEVVFPPSNSNASGQTYQQNSSDRPPTPYPSITRSAPKVEVVFPRSNRTASGQTYQQNSSDRPPTPYPSITRSAPKVEVVFPRSNRTASGQTYQQNSSDRPPTPYPSITRLAPKEEVVFPPSNRTASGQTYQQNSSDRPPTPYPRFNNPTSAGTSHVAPFPGRPSQRIQSSVRSSHVVPSLNRPSQETLSSVRSSHVTPSSAGPSHVTVSPAGPSQATPSFAGSYKENQKKRQTQRTRSRSRVNQNTRELSGIVNCVTCNGQLRLHIYLCTNGHSSCDGCRLKMARCGNCTELITGVRNITLESTLAEIIISSEERIKCSNAKDGCYLHFKRDELQNHLKECPFNIISCPVLEFSGDCDWKGTIKQLATHFNDTHPKHCEADVNKEMHIIVKELDYKVMHLVNIGFHKFLVHIRLDTSLNNIYMATQYLGTTFSASKWTYEWHVYNKKEPRRKFEYIDVCKSNATPISEVLNNNNCAVININYAKTFLNGAKLTFKFYIKKQFNNKKNIDTTSN